ncbi:DUF4391 domain-containing protein [Clostridium swellfunianum]|uniref:DUF4391 domain-containing protein n=1 Tax=Clostridium swellfunianum TaxID=1367462 RepID=UPI00202FF1EE|nr:DUF4391 domain-containing protein [Clostridium swellfunianum]MCM0647358.1 DUF4391 domain-containing protein [Clostridium swellfunianum]
MDIFQQLELNTITPVSKKIDKKAFYEQGDFNKNEKKLFIESVEKIEVSYILNSRNINVPSYEDEIVSYQSIMFITVLFRNIGHEDSIAEIINELIPNPAVLIFKYNDGINVFTALKRLNKADNNKVVIEEINSTEWINLSNVKSEQQEFINSIKLSNLSYINFYEFYKKIHESIYVYNNRKHFNSFNELSNNDNLELKKIKIAELQELELQLEKIIKAIRKETQFNKKAALNVKAKEIKQTIEKLENEIRTEC